jgi:salicylate hydroxylase
MAIEDGLVLARAIKEHQSDHERAFAGYEMARNDRTSRIVRGAEANLGRFHNEALRDSALAEAYVDVEWSEPKIKERYEWLFTYDATSVPLAPA